MVALIKEVGENYLMSKVVKSGKNQKLPKHRVRAFSNFMKEKMIVSFQGDAYFNFVTLKP